MDVGRRPAVRPKATRASAREPRVEGHHGWDEYAPFYDWENARTFGRRDVAFWQRLVTARGGRVLELGCGTGRVTVPLARTGAAEVVGIDRSGPMLGRGKTRLRRARLPKVRAGPRRHPAPAVSPGARSARCWRPTASCSRCFARRISVDTLKAVADLLPRGGVFGLELVADLPDWREYQKRVSLKGRRGRAGTPITLLESVRQDAKRGLTFFDQEFIEGRGRQATRKQFTLTFRTVSVPQMAARLEKAGFEVTAMLGDYRGGPWDSRAEVWILLASRR